MKKFFAFVALSSLLTFAILAVAQATVLEAAPPPPRRALPGSHAPASQIPMQLEVLPVTLV